MSAMPGMSSAAQERLADLSMAAATRERANRPSYLIVLSLVLLALASVLCLWAVRDRVDAASQLEAAASRAKSVEELAARMAAVREAATDPAWQKLNEPITTIYSTLQALGAEAGLKVQLGLPSQSSRPVQGQGIKRTILTYRDIREPDLAAFFRFVSLAVERVPGLEVYSLTLEPEREQWKINLAFARWERLNP
ncbi:MAG: hypothetical protein SFY95_01190 [Planctomycetota bacterium]|nr:hypothetical protein [Planctomycetota bacterium]